MYRSNKQRLVRSAITKTEQQVVYPSSIIKEGRMRNGINDGSHRGVWFYLHWHHPSSPESDEMLVEIEVAQSSIHHNKKSMKYCAPMEPPGAVNKLTRVLALHIPSKLLPHELVATWK